VFDPFCGSGTTAVAAKELDRFFVGAELEREYAELAGRRIGTAERGTALGEIRALAVGTRYSPGADFKDENLESYEKVFCTRGG